MYDIDPFFFHYVFVSKIIFYLPCSTLVPFLLDLFFLTHSTLMFTNRAAILVNENERNKFLSLSLPGFKIGRKLINFCSHCIYLLFK